MTRTDEPRIDATPRRHRRGRRSAIAIAVPIVLSGVVIPTFDDARMLLVYAGDEPGRRRDVDVVGWNALDEVLSLRALRVERSLSIVNPVRSAANRITFAHDAERAAEDHRTPEAVDVRLHAGVPIVPADENLEGDAIAASVDDPVLRNAGAEVAFAQEDGVLAHRVLADDLDDEIRRSDDRVGSHEPGEPLQRWISLLWACPDGPGVPGSVNPTTEATACVERTPRTPRPTRPLRLAVRC